MGVLYNSFGIAEDTVQTLYVLFGGSEEVAGLLCVSFRWEVLLCVVSLVGIADNNIIE